MSLNLDVLGECICDENAPIAKRMRCCFILKSMGTNEAVDRLALGMDSSSVLLKHEIMYVMGQMKLPHANSTLEKVLRNENEDPVVRHEAAEALAAIGSAESIQIIEEYSRSTVKEVAETCQIALERLRWLNGHVTERKDGEESVDLERDSDSSMYVSVDPAPAAPIRSLEELEKIYLDVDHQHSLYQRYKAMFALRNIGSNEAVEVLVKGFADSSAVFRHEIAFVLGQMQNQYAIPFLTEVLKKDHEHEMVRHEAAEALGAMADKSTVELLESFKQCNDRIVSESCDVALDIHEYWTAADYTEHV
eukprot:TRINITY_DN3071_c0_g1_i1.p1 TRINITY_DN3071_c0_g1~~TRINITY_DN3071_c0_g1_i1.p1  ORF type:complete len:323 (-),score=70.30 TRINITY_DN3071_c0_g1_i1:29-946(-)